MIREKENELFAKWKAELKVDAECIDHIAISEKFIDSSTIEIREWNLEKSLSDHKGIVVSL